MEDRHHIGLVFLEHVAGTSWFSQNPRFDVGPVGAARARRAALGEASIQFCLLGVRKLKLRFILDYAVPDFLNQRDTLCNRQVPNLGR